MNFSIFGLGNVGSNFYNNFKNKNEIITFSKNNRFNCLLKNNKTDYKKLFKKKHLFIELIGNINISIEIILNSIKNKNDFISANKDLISKYAFFLNFLFKKNNIKIYYEASVCGALPIINLLDNFYFKDKILYLFGILNGTCNYILSNIKKLNFSKLINLSIKKGIAEKQYSNDIFGIDTLYKTSIIISKINNYNIFYYNIYLESIFNLNNYIRKIFFYKKFISYFYNLNNYIFLNISLFLFKNNLIKNINNSYNFILLNYFNSQKTFLSAIGAGGNPTSYSVRANFHQSFEKKNFLNKICIKKKNIINKNLFCINYLLKLKFDYNIFFILFSLKMKFLKLFYNKNILIKLKKTYYKKILFFLFFFKNKKFIINKIL
ncbi:MAG: hypothetical protein ACM3Q5_00815 [Candidatus Carsonella ruddii]